MQRLEVSGAVRPTYGSLGVKRLNYISFGHTMDRRLVAGLPPWRSEIDPRSVHGEQNDTGTGSCPSASVVPCQNLPPVLRINSNRLHHNILEPGGILTNRPLNNHIFR